MRAHARARDAAGARLALTNPFVLRHRLPLPPPSPPPPPPPPPPRRAGSSTFAFYDLLGLDASSNILSLAYPQDPYAGEDAICYYATITPSFPSSLTVTTIGGYAFSYVDQCAAASYKLPDNNNNVATPFCRRLNATSAIALATSVVGVYSLGAPSASPSGSPSASASSSPVFFTPSAPPSGISLSQGSPSASASASVAPAPGGNTGGGDGGGGSLGGSGGDAGGGTGGSVGGGPNTFPSPSAATKGPVVSSGAQGVASLASVAVAAFLGAAVAAAFQRRN